MKNRANWRRLSALILASMALMAPAYAAEVTHSQEVELTKHPAAKTEGEVGTIEVSPEAEENMGVAFTATATVEEPQSQEEEQPRYREVRRNGVTYIEKVGKKKLEQERQQAQVDEEQTQARLTQQKEIQEAQNKQAPGRSILQQSTLNEEEINKQEDQYAQMVKAATPFAGQRVTKVTLTGASHEDASQLTDLLKMTAGSNFTQEGLQDDVRALYESGWFYDIKPVFTKVPEGVQITYELAENPVLTDVEIEGNTVISTGDIKKALGLPLQKVLNSRDVNIGARKVESLYSEQGYILAKVADVRMLDDGKLIVQVAEGVIEDFRVRGNTKTKDYVVIREMRMKKGEPFNAKKARRSMQKIYNLGFFEDVNIRLNPGQMPNTISVEISVVETSTGTFGIGAGYSDADGFLGMVNVGDKNFMGTGDSVNVRWEFGGDSETNTNFEVSYVKPWIDDKETTAGFTFYNMTNEYVDYNRKGNEIARYYKKRQGEEIFFSRVTDNEFITNMITLKNRDDKYKKPVSGYSTQWFEAGERGYRNIHEFPDDYNWDRHERLEKNFGNTRSITFTRTLDTRDNIYDPREGKRTAYSVEVANFGGDFNFEKYQADYRYYYRVGKDYVWALNLGAGYANGDLPLSQRFSVGGSDVLRGYRDDQFKGNSMLKGSLEFRYPIIKKVQGVFFTDTGYAWSKDYDESNFDIGKMKHSVGIGLRINSPLGPIKLDYGYRLESSDRGGRFHFSFGGQF